MWFKDFSQGKEESSKYAFKHITRKPGQENQSVQSTTAYSEL